jgi:hypothetical protein
MVTFLAPRVSKFEGLEGGQVTFPCLTLVLEVRIKGNSALSFYWTVLSSELHEELSTYLVAHQ